MSGLLEKGAAVLREALARFTVRRETQAIDTMDGLNEFARTRSAFVAQHKLYGYLKTRMGTRYPTMFENDALIASINLAKEHVFAACLADLTIHVVARGPAHWLTNEERREMAGGCFTAGLAAAGLSATDMEARKGMQTAMQARLADVHWENISAGADCFIESPKALYRWAPIAPELKKYDRSIVENSVRYAWNEVIRDYRNRVAGEAIAQDWKRSAGR